MMNTPLGIYYTIAMLVCEEMKEVLEFPHMYTKVKRHCSYADKWELMIS